MMQNLPIEILLPAVFFSAEERCEYHISEKQKRIWAIELDLLAKFDSLCKENSIHYSIFAGTLLGAIRHHGFIPWDDDVDVCMDRANFEKLLSLSNHVLKPPYFLQTPYNDTKFFCPYARLRNSATTGLILSQNSPDYNNGIYIDIFVLDGKPHWKMLQSVHQFFLKIAGRFVHCYNQDISRLQGWSKISVKGSKLIAHCLPFRFWISLYEKVLGMFNPFADRFALITHGYNNWLNYWLKSDEINDCIEVQFENLSLPATRHYDQVLKRIYRDYLSYPPKDKRGIWHEGVIEFDPDVPYRNYILNKQRSVP